MLKTRKHFNLNNYDINLLKTNYKKNKDCHEWLGKMDMNQPSYKRYRVRRLRILTGIDDLFDYNFVEFKKIRIGMSCKNPKCINPEHYIFNKGIPAYTPKLPENTKGEGNGRAVLTEQEVRAIRHMYHASLENSYSTLAATFNVDKTTIGKIIRRENWSHLK